MNVLEQLGLLMVATLVGVLLVLAIVGLHTVMQMIIRSDWWACLHAVPC